MISEASPMSSGIPAAATAGQENHIKLPTETSKFNGYIVVAPSPNSKDGFPKSFNLIINGQTNDVKISLWGMSISSDPVPCNSGIGPHNYSAYPFPNNLFSKTDLSGNDIHGLLIGGINIGVNALLILNAGPLFNKRLKYVGDVLFDDNILTIKVTDATDITGILICLGKPSNTAAKI